MKIKVAATIEIDPHDWTRNFGPETAAEIRQDMRSYVETAIRDQLAASGVTATVRVA